MTSPNARNTFFFSDVVDAMTDKLNALPVYLMRRGIYVRKQVAGYRVRLSMRRKL
jgi:hypothetical protein